MKSAIRLAVLSLLMGAPAQAYEVETGTVMVCDTPQLAERYVQLFDGDSARAIRAVNSEANNPNACGSVDVAFVRAPSIGTARTMSHTFEIVPIAVVAVNTPDGLRPVNAALLFSLVKVKEFAV